MKRCERKRLQPAVARGGAKEGGDAEVRRERRKHEKWGKLGDRGGEGSITGYVSSETVAWTWAGFGDGSKSPVSTRPNKLAGNDGLGFAGTGDDKRNQSHRCDEDKERTKKLETTEKTSTGMWQKSLHGKNGVEV